VEQVYFPGIATKENNRFFSQLKRRRVVEQVYFSNDKTVVFLHGKRGEGY
jgi:hypothetical protein